jgi:hypothetical protein
MAPGGQGADCLYIASLTEIAKRVPADPLALWNALLNWIPPRLEARRALAQYCSRA